MSVDYAKARFEAMGYPSNSITLETLPQNAGQNIYVTKVGSTYPNTYIEFGAHIDSVPGSPGGNDNASGSTAVIELARVLKDYPSRYSMRFILFAAEEYDNQWGAAYYGSNYHVQQMLARGEQVKAALILDHIGWHYPSDPTGYFNEVSYGDSESERIANLFNQVRGEYGISIGFGKDQGLQNSDEHSYWNYGKTAVSSGGGWIYYRPNYHGCGDTAANINFNNVLRVAQQNLAVSLKLDAESGSGSGTPTATSTVTSGPSFTPTFTVTPGPSPTPSVNTPTTTPLPTATYTPGPSTDLLFDDFAGSALLSTWFVPTGGAPGIAGGIATFNNGNAIESNGSFGDLNIFGIQAQYSPASYTGLCWTNAAVSNYVCWVPLSTNTARFAWFSSSGGEVDTGISVPSGYHRYAIARNGTLFTVYIDGTPVYSTTNGAVSVDRAYLSGYGNFAVDWACVYAEGSSCQGANTAAPTSTLLPATATNTPINTLTYTVTSIPTNTSTNTPLATATYPPTNTATPTLTSTATTVPPTSTNTSTWTPTATNTPVSGSTGWLSPNADAVQSGGDGNGYQNSPTNAYTNNSSFAVDTNSGTNTSTNCTNAGKDRHNFYNYNVAIPGTTIDGIEVRLDARADAASGTPQICVQLSWDGGITWTNTKTTAMLTTTEATYILGGTVDNWGRTWTTSNLLNTNFRLRVIDVSSNTARDFYLDYIAVRVTYH
jgi:hypothetical protein